MNSDAEDCCDEHRSKSSASPGVKEDKPVDTGAGIGDLFDDIFDLSTDGAAPIPHADEIPLADPPKPAPDEYASKGLEAKSKFHCFDHGKFNDPCPGCLAKARNRKHFKGAFERKPRSICISSRWIKYH